MDNELINRISKLLKEDKYQEALETAEEALKIHPEYATVWVMKARALNGLDRPEEALAACDKALEYDRNLFDAYYYKGDILGGQEYWEQALTEYDNALRINSESMKALFCKATVLGYKAEKGEDVPVLPIANRMIRLDPKDPRGWFVKAMALYLQRKYREAENAINQALSLDIDAFSMRPGALSIKAGIFEQTGRKNEAQKLMKSVSELAPDLAQSIKDENKEDIETSHIPTRKTEMTPDGARKRIIWSWIFTGVIGIISFLALLWAFFNVPNIRSPYTDVTDIFKQAALFYFGTWSFYWMIISLPSSFRALFWVILGGFGIAAASAAEMPDAYIATGGQGYISIQRDYGTEASYKIPIYLIALALTILACIVVAYFYGLRDFYRSMEISSPWNKKYILFSLAPQIAAIIFLIGVMIVLPASNLNSNSNILNSNSKITLEAFPSGISSGDNVVVSANVRDQDGNPMGAGITIGWTVSDTSKGTVNPSTSVTAANGVASTTFYGHSPGTVTVVAMNGNVYGTIDIKVK